MKNKKTIVICASASLYKQIIPLEEKLNQIGYKVAIPFTAKRMKKANDFTLNKSWYKNPKDYPRKRYLMNRHFKEIEKGDAVLIANFDKGEMKKYIGGNVLMEITIAYYLKKKIILLYDIDQKSAILEEIYGVDPLILNGDLNKINI